MQEIPTASSGVGPGLQRVRLRLGFAAIVFCFAVLSPQPTSAQLDIGTVVFHESFDGETSLPTTPEVNTLGLAGLDEFLDGSPGFPGGTDLSPPDRAHITVGSIDPATNSINDVYARSSLPSFGPGDAYGIRAEYDSWVTTEGGGTLTDSGLYQLAPLFGDYSGTYDAATHSYVAAALSEQVGLDPSSFFLPGVNFLVAMITPDTTTFEALPITDESLLELPFTIDLVLDRPAATATGQIRFFDGADVVMSTTLSLVGPALPLPDSVDLRVFGETAIISNLGPGDLLEVDLLDFKLGRITGVPEPAIPALLGLALLVLALARRADPAGRAPPRSP